jgi:hydroxymethylglutaryl-CoA synthase
MVWVCYDEGYVATELPRYLAITAAFVTSAMGVLMITNIPYYSFKQIDLNNKELLLIGYGSGDAAEAIPVHMVKGWETAAAKTNMAGVMAKSIQLTQEQYNAIHEGRDDSHPEFSPQDEFIVERVGSENEESFQDRGIEYYRYIN